MHSALQYLSSMLQFFDVGAQQKWIGAAILGFALALPQENTSILKALLFLFGLVPVLSYIMSINDCFDVEIDKLKEEYTGKQRIVGVIISRDVALGLSGFVLVIGLMFSWYVSISFFQIALLMAFIGTIYSVPPLRLKMKYPYSTSLLFIGDFLPFLAGISVLSFIDWSVVVMSSSFSFIALVHRFQHEIDYFEVDLETGKKTIAVVNGVRVTRMLRNICIFVGIIEFLVFILLGWFSPSFLFLFLAYLVLCVEYSIWLDHLPLRLQNVISPVLMFSGFLFFFLVAVVRLIA
ncbi:MAG: UbiA family prenyltransferase [Candidatus Bathyarchaeia archaeon]